MMLISEICPPISILSVSSTWGCDPIIGQLPEEDEWMIDGDYTGIDNGYLCFRGSDPCSILELECGEPALYFIGHPDLCDAVIGGLLRDDLMGVFDDVKP